MIASIQITHCFNFNAFHLQKKMRGKRCLIVQFQIVVASAENLILGRLWELFF